MVAHSYDGGPDFALQNGPIERFLAVHSDVVEPCYPVEDPLRHACHDATTDITNATVPRACRRELGGYKLPTHSTLQKKYSQTRKTVGPVLETHHHRP